MKTTCRLVISLGLAALCTISLSTSAARANDGGISWGGAPSLLKSHPSIAMESEIVRITVGPENAIVDCRFVFKNNGASATVRMGFPDDGEGESGFYEGAESWKKEKPEGRFGWFKSWVDGVPSQVELVNSSTPGKVWHAKSVSFGANARRMVRDQYSVPLGSQIARDGVYYQTAYTLHTGASWAGKIGRSEVIVTFARDLGAAKAPHVRAIPLAQVPFVMESGDKDYAFARAMKPGVVVVNTGPGMPTASGRTLRWVRTNWRPTQKDDIFLMFDFRSYERLQKQSKAKHEMRAAEGAP